MRDRPDHVNDQAVLSLVRDSWRPDVDRVEHLRVGFGAHHWCAFTGYRPELFVTWDRYGARHSRASLEAAYSSAVELAFALDVVVAPLVTDDLACTVPLEDGALSVTPWVHGIQEGEAPADEQARLLARLHGVRRPRPLREWQSQVPADLGQRLDVLLESPWTAGPRGAVAYSWLRSALPQLRNWIAEHTELLQAARDRPRVVTHGEPGPRNQVRTPTRLLVVDWESVGAAPRERDLLHLVRGGHGDLVDADPAMLRLFDLEWRLDEVAQYSARFAGPHDGGEDDTTALAGLREAVAVRGRR